MVVGIMDKVMSEVGFVFVEQFNQFPKADSFLGFDLNAHLGLDAPVVYPEQRIEVKAVRNGEPSI